MYTNYNIFITPWIHIYCIISILLKTFHLDRRSLLFLFSIVKITSAHATPRNEMSKKSYANNVDEYSKDGYYWRRFTYPYKMIFCYSPVKPAYSWKSWMECLLYTFISLSSTNFNHFQRKQQDFVLFRFKNIS